MSITKKPTTNILTACLALSIIFLLWRTFGTLDNASQTGMYHPTSLLLTKAQLQTRHIKPQTLPRRKIAHPSPQSQQSSTYTSAEVPAADIQHPVTLPSTDSQNAQTQPESPPGPAGEPEQGVAAPPPAEPERPVPPIVTCSQDKSRPCLLNLNQ